MTTIAVDLDAMVMASDSRCTSGDPDFSTQKIYTLGNGALVGFAGNIADALAFIDWYKKGDLAAAKPNFGDALSFTALTLDKDGCISWDSHCVPYPMLSKFYAIGTGAMVAMAAKHLGRDIQGCIELACVIDSRSGLPVVVKHYQEVKKPARRAPTKTTKKGSKK
jgi:hypothetical protein